MWIYNAHNKMLSSLSLLPNLDSPSFPQKYQISTPLAAVPHLIICIQAIHHPPPPLKITKPSHNNMSTEKQHTKKTI